MAPPRKARASRSSTSSIAAGTVAGDISRWTPGVNEGKSMDFVDNCYLIKHARAGSSGTPALPMR